MSKNKRRRPNPARDAYARRATKRFIRELQEPRQDDTQQYPTKEMNQ